MINATVYWYFQLQSFVAPLGLYLCFLLFYFSSSLMDIC